MRVKFSGKLRRVLLVFARNIKGVDEFDVINVLVEVRGAKACREIGDRKAGVESRSRP